MNKYRIIKIVISSVIITLPMFFGLIVWNMLPEQLVTSISFDGSPTGYSSKHFAVFGLPLILLGVHLLCVFATMADPKHKNIGNKMFSFILYIVPICSVFSGAVIYGTAFGINMHTESIMPVLIGVLFIILGFMLPKCKQNYTVGIKLPWTIHDEENWDKTHRMASPIWIAGGVIMILSTLFNLVYIFFAVIILIALIPAIYSYCLYRKKTKNKR